MRDLEALFEQLADVGTPRGHYEVMQGALSALNPPPVRPGRRRLAFAIALIFVITVAGVVAAMKANSGSSPTVDLPVVEPSPLRDLFDTSDQPAPPGVRYLVPTAVPTGMQLIRVVGGDRPGSVDSCGGEPGIDRAQLWAHVAPDGRPTASFFVTWGPAKASASCPLPSAHRFDDAAGGLDGIPTPVRGRTGYLHNRTIAWEEAPGTIVRVNGANLTTGELRGIAESLDRRRDGGFQVTRAPAGYIEVAESDGMAGGGLNPRELVYRRPDGSGFRIYVGDRPGAPPGANLTEALIDETQVHLTRIRDRNAIAATNLHNNPGVFGGPTFFLQGATAFLQWLEPGNVEVTISGVGMTEQELAAIANGLRIVDEQEWTQLGTKTSQLAAPPPDDQPPFTGTRAAIENAYSHWFDSISARWLATHTAGVADLEPTLTELARKAPTGPYAIDVKNIQLLDQQHARVRFDLTTRAGLHLLDQFGGASLANGQWLPDRATLCALAPLAGVQCPPS